MAQPWFNTSLTSVERTSALMNAMTFEEKQKLLHGGPTNVNNKNVGQTTGIERLGIPTFSLYDSLEENKES